MCQGGEISPFLEVRYYGSAEVHAVIDAFIVRVLDEAVPGHADMPREQAFDLLLNLFENGSVVVLSPTPSPLIARSCSRPTVAARAGRSALAPISGIYGGRMSGSSRATDRWFLSFRQAGANHQPVPLE